MSFLIARVFRRGSQIPICDGCQAKWKTPNRKKEGRVKKREFGKKRKRKNAPRREIEKKAGSPSPDVHKRLFVALTQIHSPSRETRAHCSFPSTSTPLKHARPGDALARLRQSYIRPGTRPSTQEALREMLQFLFLFSDVSSLVLLVGRGQILRKILITGVFARWIRRIFF